MKEQKAELSLYKKEKENLKASLLQKEQESAEALGQIMSLHSLLSIAGKEAKANSEKLLQRQMVEIEHIKVFLHSILPRFILNIQSKFIKLESRFNSLSVESFRQAQEKIKLAFQRIETLYMQQSQDKKVISKLKIECKTLTKQSSQQLQEINQTRLTHSTQISKYQAEIEVYKKQIEELETENEALNTQNSKQSNRVKSFEDYNSTITDELKKVEANYNELNLVYTSSLEKEVALQNEIHDLKTQNQELEEKMEYQRKAHYVVNQIVQTFKGNIKRKIAYVQSSIQTLLERKLPTIESKMSQIKMRYFGKMQTVLSNSSKTIDQLNSQIIKQKLDFADLKLKLQTKESSWILKESQYETKLKEASLRQSALAQTISQQQKQDMVLEKKENGSKNKVALLKKLEVRMNSIVNSYVKRFELSIKDLKVTRISNLHTLINKMLIQRNKVILQKLQQFIERLQNNFVHQIEDKIFKITAAMRTLKLFCKKNNLSFKKLFEKLQKANQFVLSKQIESEQILNDKSKEIFTYKTQIKELKEASEHQVISQGPSPEIISKLKKEIRSSEAVILQLRKELRKSSSRSTNDLPSITPASLSPEVSIKLSKMQTVVTVLKAELIMIRDIMKEKAPSFVNIQNKLHLLNQKEKEGREKIATHLHLASEKRLKYLDEILSLCNTFSKVENEKSSVLKSKQIYLIELKEIFQQLSDPEIFNDSNQLKSILSSSLLKFPFLQKFDVNIDAKWLSVAIPRIIEYKNLKIKKYQEEIEQNNFHLNILDNSLKVHEKEIKELKQSSSVKSVVLAQV